MVGGPEDSSSPRLSSATQLKIPLRYGRKLLYGLFYVNSGFGHPDLCMRIVEFGSRRSLSHFD